MPNLSLGTIEVLGLPAAVEAADVALKTADVKLIGYETTDGMGMVAVKIEGQVSAVNSAIAAARAASSAITKVFATSVIPRPADQLEPVVLTDLTVGLETKQAKAEPKAAAPAKPKAEAPVKAEEAPQAEPPKATPAAEASQPAPVVTEPVDEVTETAAQEELVETPTGATKPPVPPKAAAARRPPSGKSRSRKK